MLTKFSIPPQPQEEVGPVFGRTFHWLWQLPPLDPTVSADRFHLVVTSPWRETQWGSPKSRKYSVHVHDTVTQNQDPYRNWNAAKAWDLLETQFAQLINCRYLQPIRRA
jgi:hypothetical protein